MRTVRHLDLFSGIGGFALAAETVWGGLHEVVAFCDNDRFCQNVLRKHWPDARIYGDIRELTADGLATDAENDGRCRRKTERRNGEDKQKDGDAFRSEPRRQNSGTIDLLTGGFPCQPFSNAGKKRGDKDDRFLWPEMLRVIRETKPSWVIGENVAGIVRMALDQVCADLEGEGYAVQPFIIPACAIGAPHRRDRVWIVARRHPDIASEIARRSTGGSRHPVGKSGRATPDAKSEQDRRVQQSGLSSDTRTVGERHASNAAGKGFPKPRQARRWQFQEEAEKGLHNRPQLTGGVVAPYAKGSRQRQEYQVNRRSESGDRTKRHHGSGSATRTFQREEWRRDWREVALATCHDGVDARVPQWMDLLLGRLNYASSYEKITDEELRTLLRAVPSSEVQWPFGGRDEIPTQTFLLRTMRWLQGQREISGWLLQRGSAEVSEKELRAMRDEIETARTSRGRESVEQRAKELADALPFLPLETSLAVTQGWDDIRILQEKFGRTALVALPDGSTISEAALRRESLKAYGNAIVPQVAVEIMRKIKDLGL